MIQPNYKYSIVIPVKYEIKYFLKQLIDFKSGIFRDRVKRYIVT